MIGWCFDAVKPRAVTSIEKIFGAPFCLRGFASIFFNPGRTWGGCRNPARNSVMLIPPPAEQDRPPPTAGATKMS